MRKALTDTFLKSVAPPTAGRLDIIDVKTTGLSFRVTAGGARSWNFRFRDPRSGRTTRATIGPYPIVSLAKAREHAETLRRQVSGGENPIEVKRRERADADTRTFAALAARYLAEHARRHKRSADADERNLRLHVLPKWSKRRYDEIRRADVIELLESLVTAGKPTLANRVQALISSIFSFAMDADLVKGNPCARLRRRGTENVGRRVLSDDELRLFWPNIMLPPVSRRVGLALRLVLLTGARPGEVAGLARSEIENLADETKARWIIPAERSKNRRSHLVPLSEAARQTITAALELTGNDGEYVFPSPTVRHAPITAHALAVAMARFAGQLDTEAPWRPSQTDGPAATFPGGVKTWQADPPSPHDLRRTVATRLAELGIPKEDRDAVLNHTPRDVGKRHYDLYEREREKRRALDLWAAVLAQIIEDRGGERVVPITKAKQ